MVAKFLKGGAGKANQQKCLVACPFIQTRAAFGMNKNYKSIQLIK